MPISLKKTMTSATACAAVLTGLMATTASASTTEHAPDRDAGASAVECHRLEWWTEPGHQGQSRVHVRAGCPGFANKLVKMQDSWALDWGPLKTDANSWVTFEVYQPGLYDHQYLYLYGS